MKLQVQDISESSQICEVKKLYRDTLDNGDFIHFYTMLLLSKTKYRKFYVFLHNDDLVGFMCLKENNKEVKIISYGIKDGYKSRGYDSFMFSIIKNMYAKKESII